MRALLGIHAVCEVPVEEEIVSGVENDPDIQQKSRTMQLLALTSAKKDILRVHSDIALPQSSPNIGHLLYDYVEVRNLHMSRRMHAFIREHIVRGYWKNRPRPVLLNSWEACYFDISESRLLKLAKAGKDAGIELFVVDDGWFGRRNDDTSSLGDWVPNTKKLPGGLSRLAKKITDLGLAFGIWVEPEMVSVDSDLYRKHPELDH